MAIKLVRKVKEVEGNRPITLNENLFVKVRDLSEQTEMSIDELVNYFVSEAILQVEFDDDVVEMNVEADDKTFEAKEDSDEQAINYNKFDKWINEKIYNEYGMIPYGEKGKVRNRVVVALKHRVRCKNVNDMANLYVSNPKLIEKELDGYFKAVKKLGRTDVYEYNKPITYDFDDEFKEIMYKFYEKGQKHLAHRASDFKSSLVKKYNGIDNLKRLFNEDENVREEITKTIKKYANDPVHLKEKNPVPVKKEKSSTKIIRPITKVTAEEVKSRKEDTVKEPTYIKLPDTYERDLKMDDLYKFGRLKFKGGNINREMQSVYEKMRKKYGIVVEQLKKDYKNKYGVEPRSTIDAVKADDEAWSIFYPMIKDELEFIS